MYGLIYDYIEIIQSSTGTSIANPTPDSLFICEDGGQQPQSSLNFFQHNFNSHTIKYKFYFK